jgi:hypothetical protein
MEACEVGINVTVDVQAARGFYDHPHATSAIQIADESLDYRGISFLWVMAESATWLTAQAMSRRGLVEIQVEQHTGYVAVAPSLFFHGRSAGVDSESGLSSWRPIVIAVGQTSCFLDLLNQTFLGVGQCSIQQILK